jgi:hypothetical protein
MEESERRGGVVGTPVSYSGSAELKSRPGDQFSWLSFFLILLSPSSKGLDST